VKLPKFIRKNKEALSKEEVINILNHCSHIKVKTYVMLLTVAGMRTVEALHISVKDVYFDNKPAKIYV
jgi:integrase